MGIIIIPALLFLVATAIIVGAISEKENKPEDRKEETDMDKYKIEENEKFISEIKEIKTTGRTCILNHLIDVSDKNEISKIPKKMEIIADYLTKQIGKPIEHRLVASELVNIGCSQTYIFYNDELIEEYNKKKYFMELTEDKRRKEQERLTVEKYKKWKLEWESAQ